jgi:hypothetical protein
MTDGANLGGTAAYSGISGFPSNLAAAGTNGGGVLNSALQSALTSGSVIPAVASTSNYVGGYAAAAIASPGVNLLQNSTFVQGLNSWTPSATGQWNYQPIANGGSGAGGTPYCFVQTPGTALLTSQNILVGGGTAYSLQAQIYTSGITAGQARCRIIWYNAAGTEISETDINVTHGVGWALYTLPNQVSPSTATYANIVLDTVNAAYTANGATFSSGGLCSWGQIKFEQGSTCTPWNDAGTTSALYSDGTGVDALRPAQAGAIAKVTSNTQIPVNLALNAAGTLNPASPLSVPTSPTNTINISATTYTGAGGATISIPSGSITGLSYSTTYAVFYNTTAGTFTAVSSGGTSYYTSLTQYVSLGNITTGTSGGTGGGHSGGGGGGAIP